MCESISSLTEVIKMSWFRINNRLHKALSNGLEFKAESPTLVVGIHSSTSTLKLDHALTCSRSHCDAKTLQLCSTILLPSRQCRRLIRWDDDCWWWRLVQLVVTKVRLFAINDRFKQLATWFSTRQHVVAGAHMSKELRINQHVALRWHVCYFEIQRLLWLTGTCCCCCWTAAGSQWFGCWCLQKFHSQAQWYVNNKNSPIPNVVILAKNKIQMKNNFTTTGTLIASGCFKSCKN